MRNYSRYAPTTLAGLKMPGTYESNAVLMITHHCIGLIERLCELAGETVPTDLNTYTAAQAAGLHCRLIAKTAHLRRNSIRSYKQEQTVETNTAWLIERTCKRIGVEVPMNLYGMTENQAEDFRLTLCKIEYDRSQKSNNEVAA